MRRSRRTAVRIALGRCRRSGDEHPPHGVAIDLGLEPQSPGRLDPFDERRHGRQVFAHRLRSATGEHGVGLVEADEPDRHLLQLARQATEIGERPELHREQVGRVDARWPPASGRRRDGRHVGTHPGLRRYADATAPSPRRCRHADGSAAARRAPRSAAPRCRRFDRAILVLTGPATTSALRLEPTRWYAWEPLATRTTCRGATVPSGVVGLSSPIARNMRAAATPRAVRGRRR